MHGPGAFHSLKAKTLGKAINAFVLVLALASAAAWADSRRAESKKPNLLAIDHARSAPDRLPTPAGQFSSLISTDRINAMRVEIHEELCRHKGEPLCLGTFCLKVWAPSVSCRQAR